MSAAILSIGTELTRGELVDTNSAWLATELTSQGLEVTAIDCVADDPAAIADALARLSGRHAVLVSTGGLGPTTDDITAECVARALGAPLERHAPSLEAIRARVQRFGRSAAASNDKQADFPRGADVLPNDWGTAPGFAVRLGQCRAFFLPGVPREMKPMFQRSVLPELRDHVAGHVHQVRLQTFGLPEAVVNDRLAGVEAEYGVTVGYRAHFPTIEVKTLARAGSAQEAEVLAERAAAEVERRLGEHVFARGARTLPETLGELLLARGWRMGTAESCTGGLVAALLTEHPGASRTFEGSVVSYSNALKRELLGVPAALLERHGAVSAEVARAMAEGALTRLGVELTVALSGVAGPDGGTEDKPVGLVHLAIATREGVSARELRWPGERAQVQRLAAYSALYLARRVLLRGHQA